MVAVNSLGMEGLRTVLGINATTQKAAAGAKISDVLAAKDDSIIVSALAKDVGEIYQRVKETGNAEAAAGFSKIIQNFGSELSGQAIVDVVQGAQEMSASDLQRYGELANTIADLGSSATLGRFARQSAQVFTVDAELGRSYLGATEAIVTAGYSGDRGEVVDQKLENLSNFMSTFDELPTSGEGMENAIDFYRKFAEQIAASLEGNEISQAINDFSPDQDSSSA